MKNTIQQPLKRFWTGSVVKNGKFQSLKRVNLDCQPKPVPIFIACVSDGAVVVLVIVAVVVCTGQAQYGRLHLESISVTFTSSIFSIIVSQAFMLESYKPTFMSEREDEKHNMHG